MGGAASTQSTRWAFSVERSTDPFDVVSQFHYDPRPFEEKCENFIEKQLALMTTAESIKLHGPPPRDRPCHPMRR
jgi:hypothetical protein